MDGDKARIQFIRILDRVAEARKVTWKIVGDYAKQVALGGNPGLVSQLEIVLTPNKQYTQGGGELIRDLYIMGFVTQWNQELEYSNTKVEIFGHNFECVFYEHKHSYVFASDQISLSTGGISVVQMDAFDFLNMNKGISLIERLSGLRSRIETQIIPLHNMPENVTIRGKNALIIRRVNNALRNSYTIKGDSTLAIDKITDMSTCPVCFENDRFTTTLECSHTFCLECLASHMERSGDCHGKCPMCRRPLMLKIVN
jgi:hypothetical protein